MKGVLHLEVKGLLPPEVKGLFPPEVSCPRSNPAGKAAVSATTRTDTQTRLAPRGKQETTGPFQAFNVFDRPSLAEQAKPC